MEYDLFKMFQKESGGAFELEVKDPEPEMSDDSKGILDELARERDVGLESVGEKGLQQACKAGTIMYKRFSRWSDVRNTSLAFSVLWHRPPPRDIFEDYSTCESVLRATCLEVDREPGTGVQRVQREVWRRAQGDDQGLGETTVRYVPG